MATENSHSDWWTPEALALVVKDEFNFDLDAAAEAENTLAPRFITREQDALRTPWDGERVWCNPPYGEGHSHSIRDFVERAYTQHLEQQNTIVMLLPAYTDPRYWRDFVMKAHEIRFLTGRLAFLEAGQKKMSARFPSALVIWKWFPGHCYKGPHTWLWDWRIDADTN